MRQGTDNYFFKKTCENAKPFSWAFLCFFLNSFSLFLLKWERDFTYLNIFQTCMSEGQATLIWAWIVAVFCIGGMIGGSCVGLIASGLGR